MKVGSTARTVIVIAVLKTDLIRLFHPSLVIRHPSSVIYQSVLMDQSLSEKSCVIVNVFAFSFRGSVTRIWIRMPRNGIG